MTNQKTNAYLKEIAILCGIAKEITPEVLIISNRYDFSTDFICVELEKKGTAYWRINRDELHDYDMDFNPIIPSFVGTYKDIKIKIDERHLSSIYYRAPTFLRDIYQDQADEEEQLKRTQWAAFVRSLCVFEEVKWVNNPVQTYRAEIKAYQLYKAHNIGFRIPETIITNKMHAPRLIRLPLNPLIRQL